MFCLNVCKCTKYVVSAEAREWSYIPWMVVSPHGAKNCPAKQQVLLTTEPFLISSRGVLNYFIL